MRLIDADAMIGILEARASMSYVVDASRVFLNVQRIVNAMPTVYAEPVRHGRWEYDQDGMDFNIGAWVCSECKSKNDNLGGLRGISPYRFVGSRYCPNCGAKMDGDSHGD